MKILVTGSDGTVGSYISSTFSNDLILLTTHKTMDITDAKSVERRVSKFKPDVIIHLAAATNVDEAEKKPKIAEKINAKGSENIAKEAKKVGAKLIYISTSAIFDGSKISYDENAVPSPINNYGKSKLKGEKAIQTNMHDYYIIRCGWIIGGGEKEKKFLSHILRQIKDGKTEIKAVSDLYGSVTYAKELVEFMKKIIKTDNFGIHHFSSTGTVSRFELAKFFVKNLSKKVKVIPVSSSEFSSIFSAPRPKYEVVISIKKQYDSTWKESVKRYIKDEIKEK